MPVAAALPPVMHPPQIAAYLPRRRSQVETITIRGLAAGVRLWGKPDAQRLFLLHGGRDSSITFQFMVDAFARDWRIIAPDWRGHGESAWAPGGYWFQDYVADLDALLDHYSADEPVRLVGHSLGGNVASIFAGIRPERISHLVSLDGFGIPDGDPSTAPDRIRAWLDGIRLEPTMRAYSDVAAVVKRLELAHPRLDPAKVAFLASHWVAAAEDGALRWRFDPNHRITFPTVTHFADWAACFGRVTAPVLWLASESEYADEFVVERLRHFRRADYERLTGTSHNLHHDAPARVAELVEAFL